MRLPRLSEWPLWPEAEESAHPWKAIVFIHGIFSSHVTFEAMRDRLGEMARFSNNVRYFYYDYDFHDGLSVNGVRFAQELSRVFQPDDEVAIVAHSMGGLVARLAVLSMPMPFLRVIFLLGTPNSGAIRLSQLTLLSQMVQASTGLFFALFSRKSGVTDLTRAALIMQEHRGGAENAIETDYVSIPGLYFHAERRWWEIQRDGAAVGFTLWDAVISRTLSVRMNRPHDGIVEETSNSLFDYPSGFLHEKINSTGDQRGDDPATYAHVKPGSCRALNHVQIHNDPEVIEVIASIIAANFRLGAPEAATLAHPVNVETWARRLTMTEKTRIDVRLTR
jgi:pimeloyl-ACP methyl ester carboxylesterase